MLLYILLYISIYLILHITIYLQLWSKGTCIHMCTYNRTNWQNIRPECINEPCLNNNPDSERSCRSVIYVLVIYVYYYDYYYRHYNRLLSSIKSMEEKHCRQNTIIYTYSTVCSNFRMKNTTLFLSSSFSSINNQ